MALFVRSSIPSFSPSIETCLGKRSDQRRANRWLFLALLVVLNAAVVRAQDYTSIVVFGDSLSDTGNVTHLTLVKYGLPIPSDIADYTYGRFTDGFDTQPAAEAYRGVWIDQLAATFPAKPVVKNSLDGGTNYAYGSAATGSGMGLFTFGPSNSLFVNINNIGQQITDYLATHPKINDHTLFVVWGGAIDVLHATSSKDVVDAAITQAANVERLIDAGATRIIVPNLPPLGAVPRLNGSPATSIPGTEASILFNKTLAAGLDIVSFANHRKHLKIFQLDVFALFNKVIASPKKYDLMNVTGSSQGVIPVNPDTYLFWDDLHPTTRGHDIVALAAAKLIAPEKCWREDWRYERELAESEDACSLR